jgi:alpha-tubulin suppressor-like RCC1 family protein
MEELREKSMSPRSNSRGAS